MKGMKIIPTKLKGSVMVPPSKSMAHRAIICASLAKGKSRIDHIEYSQDIKATIEAMRALGTKIEMHDDYLLIDGGTTYSKDRCLIDCKESGSTLRFMVPISLVTNREVVFVGEGNLGKRPLQVYYDIFDKQGIAYQYTSDILDLHIAGKLEADHFMVPGDISSQFISGMLFAFPLLEKDSIIEITSPLQSAGYIDLTLQMLSAYGIEVINEQYQRFIIPGNQEYRCHDYYVEADYSQAAFYLVADALGNEIEVQGLNPDSLQGDRIVISLLKDMGSAVVTTSKGIMMNADRLNAITIDGRQCPDIIPVMALACSLAKGTSEIVHSERLRMKECDRLEATYQELSKLGVSLIQRQDGLMIQGLDELSGNSVSSWNDHRMAMTLAIASTCASGPIILDNYTCVQKSYPSFWQDFISLGGQCDECELG